MMTDRAAIAAEYLRREAEANRRPEGADHAALMLSVGMMFGVPPSFVRQAVLDHDGTGVG
jgi:hypothetical protein